MSLENLLNDGGKISNLMKSGLGNAQEIDIDLIDIDPNQPRKDFDKDSIKALSKSIKEHGLLQPISVREGENGRYVINYGERRYKACIQAGLKKIKAFLENDYSVYAQVVENVLREDLSLVDRLKFFAEQKKLGFTNKQIQEKISHPDKSYISRHMTILDAPELILDRIYDGTIKSLEVGQTLTSKFNAGQKDEVRLFLESISEGETATTSLLRQFFKKDEPKSSNGEEKGEEGEGGKTGSKPAKDKRDKVVQNIKKLKDDDFTQLEAIITNDAVLEQLKLLDDKAIKALSDLLLYTNNSDEDIKEVFEQGREQE
ncbi:ParB/RepB/Spo0J family partition protein [Acinetobacter baumannii]|uniref:ParB/RepB/Spo0J family partition protein n=2 Tax=Acinetobacter baumannii TaxID=470 RepID=UPI00028339A6|nr:ParB/RepB/Spo0J family partition protein [Acinetobacter baumannii]EHU3033160.1 ParB/RepB/Spo0J family partition protein [Acinetobacter baumannii]EIB7144066.1 ParB/RepB/Spo0J family partition protein [Acinetobacter baumannii]EKA71950.1 ParB-like protein [Acinetobacter baumannii IS-58]EKK06231.1 ParB-like protein [Acinetobacter baumannii IS-235]EKU0974524.1 ParB/RepB/Spo0J family partition protein [Acinetobacter baumannii]